MADDDLAPGAIADPVTTPAPPEYQHLGSFMAVVAFRPADGSDVQRYAGFAETEQYARAEVLTAVHNALGMVQTMAPDTPQVRVFIAAASHMHDLRQASDALASAAASDNATTAMQLRTFAVLAYCRTYASKARADLETFITLSPAQADLSARLKTIRNKYGAHSENNMTVTVPVLDLQRDLDGTIRVEQVSGITAETPMPAEFIAEFESMLSELINQLTAALPPLQDAVRAGLTIDAVNEAFSNPQPLRVVRAALDEWEPTGRRLSYPDSPVTPVQVTHGGSSTVHLTITR